MPPSSTARLFSSQPGHSFVLSRTCRKIPKVGKLTENTRQASTNVSSALHFYQNRQLELYAAKATKRLTLRQLVFFGRSMNEDRLVQAANYVRTELPVRIAHRLRDMQALPYIVVTQEEVARVYEPCSAILESVRQFRSFPTIYTMSDNLRFCELVRTLLHEHSSIIPSLALGLSLSSPHLPPEQLDAFMSRMLISRVSRRVLAEHHIALTDDFVNQKRRKDAATRVGIINTELRPTEAIEKCAKVLEEAPAGAVLAGTESTSRPTIVVEGHLDVKFAYIRDQLEYVLFELLKNAFFATSLFHANSPSFPVIRATIAAGQDEIQIRISDQGGGLVLPEISSPADLLSFSHVRNNTRMDTGRIGALKSVSVRPQGMVATVEEQIRSWNEDRDASLRAERDESGRSVTRVGIGLPMSNIFATYFGGSLELVSLDGWGTDVYLRLPRLGTNLEGI